MWDACIENKYGVFLAASFSSVKIMTSALFRARTSGTRLAIGSKWQCDQGICQSLKLLGLATFPEPFLAQRNCAVYYGLPQDSEVVGSELALARQQGKNDQCYLELGMRLLQSHTDIASRQQEKREWTVENQGCWVLSEVLTLPF